jgi:hypothetical protein
VKEARLPHPLTVLVTVSSTHERDNYIKRIFLNLTKEPSREFTIAKDQVNRIRIYKNIGQTTRILVRTYLIIVIPVLVELSPLDSITGLVDFHLDETIDKLETLTAKLKAMQGQRLVKESNATLEKLVDELRRVNDKY